MTGSINTNIQTQHTKSQVMEDKELKDQIFRVYFYHGKADGKGKYQKGYVKVTATNQKEARDKAIKMGPNEGIKVVKWNNAMVLDKDQ